MTSKRLKNFILFTICSGASAFFVLPVQAQSQSIDIGQNILADLLNLPEKDPRLIVAELINVFIGFLSLIFVILILRAGFLFMISGGDKEKTDHAKRSIVNAIIGLILVLSAWTITTFSIDTIINALTSGN